MSYSKEITQIEIVRIFWLLYKYLAKLGSNTALLNLIHIQKHKLRSVCFHLLSDKNQFSTGMCAWSTICVFPRAEVTTILEITAGVSQ